MRPILFLPLSLIWLLMPSCGKKAAAKPPQMPPAAVTFVPASTETVTITRDLPGRIDAVRVAEVRARVAGILLKKTFQEGAEVKAGDVLFQIDPAPLEAARDSAEANFARADANAKQADNDARRFRELVAVNAVSKQDADNSESAVAVASAELLAAKAQRATAELNLGYATVTAPISGRTGKAQVTEGALVGQNDATLLAVIQQLDPIYFDFTQSSTDLIALKKAGSDESKVTLLLEDGTEYEHPGRLLFSEASVDQTTGMVTLRAEFPNPKTYLLPGMFARARVVQAVKEDVVTVPQRAVSRGAGGAGTVMVIDETNHAQARIIQTAEGVGDKWVVASGLKAGERVMMEGHLKARPGAPVVPEPYAPAQAAGQQSSAIKH
ncbi:MAG: efflux RND transporter periplasmic adaptor subunit [Verrucomicrobiota bacterium]